ncbi:MAG: copper resistance system multicopper oxidase [Gammaproteobacteria bacterium]|nr:copper resistance system multicopper oxidase [Gammaproteobacteria bacterium]
MHYLPRLTRRRFIANTLTASACLPLPAWALSGSALQQDIDYKDVFDLKIGNSSIVLDGRSAPALAINGTIPGPLLRLREGRRIRLNVSNALAEDTSIHWHGLLLPPDMDGVPGISFAGIAPGDTYHYEFDVVQNGTYWYHSHSGLQEQLGVYGPLIIDPEHEDNVQFDRELVVLLSDWTFEDPQTVFRNLKMQDTYYNYTQRTASDLLRDARQSGWPATLADRGMWGRMRMTATDIADVSGATYSFLINGHDPAGNWTGIYKSGERVRLRFINGSAMSIFNVRIPGLEMRVVQADGVDVEPVTIDEFQIGTAETYDVVVQPNDERAYTLFAESIDSSGYARGTLAPRRGMTAEVPKLRKPPLLGMNDMGMDHAAMQHSDMSTHGPQHAGMQHAALPSFAHNHPRGPGVANVTENPGNRLAEPGTGLENAGHRVLTYGDLRSLKAGRDRRKPQRTVEVHLTGNMHRYMWSFDGRKYSEIEEPIVFYHGERLRLVLVNDTMMNHPIHLHGMFVELDNGNGHHNPHKHTMVVKPGAWLAANITANAAGDWAFHCHLLYHMKAGMMSQVSVVPAAGSGNAA